MAIIDPITEILLPNENISITNWTATSGGGAHPDVSADDTDYITSSTLTGTFAVGFTDLQGDVGSVISVQLNTIFGTTSPVKGHTITLRFNYNISGRDIIGLNDDIVGIEKYLSQNTIVTGTLLNSALYSWSESSVNALEVQATYQAQNASIDAAVDYMFLKVKYFPVLNTYDSTANNTHVTSGNMSISSGNISI